MDKRCRNETTLWLKFELISLYVANDRAYYWYNSIEWIFYNHWRKNDIRQSVHGYKAVLRLRLCEQDRLRQVLAAHIFEVLLWCWDILHLRPSASYNGEDNNDYVDGKGFCWMTAAWRLRRHELCRELQRITSKKATHTRRCSSTTIQTIWVAVVTSPTLTARWCSILSMYLSVRFSLRNAITFQIIH